MNCNQAKQIPITEYLKKSDFKPETIKGDNHWSLSPLREEKTASFKVNAKRNAWYDFGTGEGGNLIDLGIRLKNCSVETFLSTLKAGDYAMSTYEVQDNTVKSSGPDKKVLIHSVSELQSLSLLYYLRQRSIEPQIAKPWCKEVRFSFGQKQYTAIGFKNRSGGYELRNNWFKGSSSPKDFTFINNGSKAVCVTEGFIDFLSLQQLKIPGTSEVDFVILNSHSFVSKSVELVKAHRDIFLYLNHDPAGQQAARILADAGIRSIDASAFYQGFNDINDYLCNHFKGYQNEEKAIYKGVTR
jgi:hypothetical protein